MTERATTWWLAAGTGLLAAVVSLGRILISNHQALTDLIWAEDGLFPLCVKAQGMGACTFEPYAGYLLLLPRAIAVPVSAAPLRELPLASNLAAALLAGGLAALVVLVLRAGGSGLVAAGFVALLPVLIPLMNIEAINASASSYMVLPFVAALAVSFPPAGRFPTVAYASLLLVSELTNPLTVLLVVIVAVHGLRGRLPRRVAWILCATLGAGLVAQAIAAKLSTTPRLVEWSAESAYRWASNLPDALMTFVPGATQLSANGSLQSSLTASWGPTAGVIAAVAVLGGGVILLVRGSVWASGIGMLLIFGLLVGLIPATAGYANNRYFIAAALCWTAAAVLALDRLARRRRELLVGIACAVLVAMCLPAFPASEFRTVATPPWPRMLDVARMRCAGSAEGETPMTFTPGWPLPEVTYSGATSNVMPCRLLGAP